MDMLTQVIYEAMLETLKESTASSRDELSWFCTEEEALIERPAAA